MCSGTSYMECDVARQDLEKQRKSRPAASRVIILKTTSCSRSDHEAHPSIEDFSFPPPHFCWLMDKAVPRPAGLGVSGHWSDCEDPSSNLLLLAHRGFYLLLQGQEGL